MSAIAIILILFLVLLFTGLPLYVLSLIHI